MARVLEVKHSSAVRQAAGLHTHIIIRKELSEPCKTEHKQIQSFHEMNCKSVMLRHERGTSPQQTHSKPKAFYTWALSMGNPCTSA